MLILCLFCEYIVCLFCEYIVCDDRDDCSAPPIQQSAPRPSSSSYPIICLPPCLDLIEIFSLDEMQKYKIQNTKYKHKKQSAPRPSSSYPIICLPLFGSN